MAQANQNAKAPAQGPIPGNLVPLTTSFKQLQMELRACRLGRKITKFNGDGYKKFRQWLNDIALYRHIALQTLRKIKQRSGESIQSFAERTGQLADEAYPNMNKGQPPIQNSLVEANDGIAMLLMRTRQNFQNFDQAVDAAVQEQQGNKQFGVRRSGEEPMDVFVISHKSTQVKAFQVQ